MEGRGPCPGYLPLCAPNLQETLIITPRPWVLDPWLLNKWELSAVGTWAHGVLYPRANRGHTRIQLFLCWEDIFLSNSELLGLSQGLLQNDSEAKSEFKENKEMEEIQWGYKRKPHYRREGVVQEVRKLRDIEHRARRWAGECSWAPEHLLLFSPQ